MVKLTIEQVEACWNAGFGVATLQANGAKNRHPVFILSLKNNGNIFSSARSNAHRDAWTRQNSESWVPAYGIDCYGPFSSWKTLSLFLYEMKTNNTGYVVKRRLTGW